MQTRLVISADYFLAFPCLGTGLQDVGRDIRIPCPLVSPFQAEIPVPRLRQADGKLRRTTALSRIYGLRPLVPRYRSGPIHHIIGGREADGGPFCTAPPHISSVKVDQEDDGVYPSNYIPTGGGSFSGRAEDDGGLLKMRC